MRAKDVFFVGAAVCLLSGAAAASPGQVLRAFTAPGFSPSGLGWDGASIWVANLRTASQGGLDRVTSHDPVTFAQQAVFTMPAGHYYHGMAFDAAGNLYADDLYTKIVKLTKGGAQLAQRSAQGMAYGVAVVPSSGNLLQVDWQTRTLHELTMAGASVGATPLAMTDANTGGIAFDGATLWVVGMQTDTVYRVNTATGATVATFPAPGTQIEGIAWDGKCLWMSDTSLDRVIVVDHGQSDLPTCTVAIAPDAGASGDAGADAGPRDAGARPQPRSDGGARRSDASDGQELPLPPGGGATPDGDAGIDYLDVTSSPGCGCRSSTRDATQGLGTLAIALFALARRLVRRRT
jgi:sugar lactone lactonase YvrE